MKKIFGKFEDFLYKMCCDSDGTVSSKRSIGSFTYSLLVLALVVLTFWNPGFPGITEIYITTLLTSASLIGLTTYENIRKISGQKEEEEA